jgi:hypothetical protein
MKYSHLHLTPNLGNGIDASMMKVTGMSWTGEGLNLTIH